MDGRTPLLRSFCAVLLLYKYVGVGVIVTIVVLLYCCVEQLKLVHVSTCIIVIFAAGWRLVAQLFSQKTYLWRLYRFGADLIPHVES